MHELIALTVIAAVCAAVRLFLARWLLDRCRQCGRPVEELASHRCPPPRAPKTPRVEAGPVLAVPGEAPADDDAPDVSF